MSTANYLIHDYSLRHFKNVNQTQNQLSHRINANVTDNKIASRGYLFAQNLLGLLRNTNKFGPPYKKVNLSETQQSLVNTEPLTDMSQWLVSDSLTALTQMLQLFPAMG